MRVLSVYLNEVGMKIDQGKTQFISVGESSVLKYSKDFITPSVEMNI